MLGNAPNWILTFHSACGRILPPRGQGLLATARTSRSTHQADQIRRPSSPRRARQGTRSGSSRAASQPDLDAKNNLVGPEEYKERIASFYDQTVADAYELYQSASPTRTQSLRRHALPHRQGAARLPGGARALAERPSGTILSTSTRTRTTRSTGSPAPGRKAQERLRRGRSGPVHLRLPRRRHPQHYGVRTRFPGHAHDCPRANYRSTNAILRCGQRGHIEHASEAERALSDLGEVSPWHALESRTSREARFGRGGGRRRLRARRKGLLRSEIGVFYRRTPVSRVWRTCSSAKPSPTR